jgi:hypothetical protein
MTEPTITCSQCKAEIKLTESLAAPLLASIRQQYELKISQKEAEVSDRETSIREQQAALSKFQEELDERVAEKLKSERQTIVDIEAEKARKAVADQITQAQLDKAASEELLKDRENKLAEARKNEHQLRKDRQALEEEKEQFELKMQRALDDERIKIRECALKEAADQINQVQQEKAATEELLKDRENKLAIARENELELRKDRQLLQEEKQQFELEMQRTLDLERTKIRESALKEADEQSRLKIAEREKTITDLQAQLQEALRKADQGSQQLQGEIQELELESLLRTRFPRDNIEPVPKGQFGGDTLQHVFNPFGQHCGTILWESKRTKNWSDSWLSKLREDQRTAKADIAIIMSQVLPEHIEAFDFMDGVWVTKPQYLIPVTVVLRQSLIDLSAVRQATDGQQTKMEMVYQYLTGPRFRHRVEAIVEKFADMQEDLEKERKLMTRLWSKREAQIRGVIDSTAGMYGDLQGIAGKTLQEIEGLDIKMLDTEEEVSLL